MSFFKKYDTYFSQLLKKNYREFSKNEKNKFLIKLFDKPARKALTLISTIIINQNWSITKTSLKDKYKIELYESSLKSLHNINLWVFI